MTCHSSSSTSEGQTDVTGKLHRLTLNRTAYELWMMANSVCQADLRSGSAVVFLFTFACGSEQT